MFTFILNFKVKNHEPLISLLDCTCFVVLTFILSRYLRVLPHICLTLLKLFNFYDDTPTVNFLQVAEITRILRSGGVFVGSTFLRYSSSTPWFIRPFREVNSGRDYLQYPVIITILSVNILHAECSLYLSFSVTQSS